MEYSLPTPAKGQIDLETCALFFRFDDTSNPTVSSFYFGPFLIEKSERFRFRNLGSYLVIVWSGSWLDFSKLRLPHLKI